MKRLFFKLMLAFFGMAALTIGLIWLVQAVILKDSYLNERVASINTATEQVILSTETDYADLEASLNVSLLAVDESGGVLYQSEGMPMRGQIVKKIPELIASAGGGAETLQTETEEARYALLSRAVGGGYLLIVFSLVDVAEASRVLLEQLWVITAVLLAAAMLLSALLSRLFTRPILRVTTASKQMAAGNYGVRVPVTTKDEIGQLTRALNELGDELGKAENLRRELIANVSHELRAPLTIIQGYAETVRDITWPDEQKRTSQLTMISDEAVRLSGMVNDILDYSKLESGAETVSPARFDGGAALSELIVRYEIEAGKKDVALELTGAEGDLLFDPGKFAQVMNNLLGNAVQHASRRSIVRVRCEPAGSARRISVENAGVPIPAEELERIWERYHRAPQTGSAGSLGTGLGLAIVKSILVQHGVCYGVESDDKRTVFWFETMRIDSAG
ncbi:MAG TPA: ATP-binding protein [Feifaniaceae bacterium]|nr:ATP-binding protein [Feifaniaceae bacterium]